MGRTEAGPTLAWEEIEPLRPQLRTSGVQIEGILVSFNARNERVEPLPKADRLKKQLSQSMASSSAFAHELSLCQLETIADRPYTLSSNSLEDVESNMHER
ncbi:MAG: hypothetical protein Q9200_004423 [Gallowayella weberi]